MKSIQRRLSFGLFAALIVSGLVLAQAGLWLLDQALRSYFAHSLREETENILVALSRGQSGIQLDTQHINPAFSRPYSGRYFIVVFDDNVWRSRSLWDNELKPADRPGLTQGLVRGPERQHLLLYRYDYRRLGRMISISVGMDYTPILRRFERTQYIGLGIGAVALLIVLLVQRLIVRSAFKPLENTRQQIAQLQHGDRSQLDENVPIELEPLVEQINRLLQHTEDNLKRSRNALGNLGHALKTPLAVLVTLIERPEIAANPGLQQKLRDQLDQIGQRLERELGKARWVGETLPGVHFDCDTELPALCETLQLIHGQRVHLSCHFPPGIRLPWDRENMLEMLGNLLDNACKWAQKTVRLTVESAVDEAVFLIDDDGPGIAPELRDSVLTRGTRLDEQVAGHGLGLAIARDIARLKGGSLELEQSPLGGLRIRIRLPLAG